MNKVPSSPDGSKRSLRKLLSVAILGAAAGVVTADEVPKNIRKEVAVAAVAAGLAGLAMPDTKQKRKPEVVGSRMLTFDEAASFLNENNIPIDLQRKREEDKAFRIRALGVNPKKADEDDAKFNEGGIVSEKGLQELLIAYRNDPNSTWEPEFDLQDETDSEAYNKHIVDGLGKGRHFEWRTLDKYKIIDPKTGKALQDQRPTGKPRIVFTPTMQNVDRKYRNISANDQLKKMKEEGAQYMTPARHIKLWLKSLDEGLRVLYPGEYSDNMEPDKYKELAKKALTAFKMDGDKKVFPIDKYLIDTETATQFPNFRNADGAREDADLTSVVAPSLRFRTYPDDRGVDLDDCLPAHARDGVGARPELG